LDIYSKIYGYSDNPGFKEESILGYYRNGKGDYIQMVDKEFKTKTLPTKMIESNDSQFLLVMGRGTGELRLIDRKNKTLDVIEQYPQI